MGFVSLRVFNFRNLEDAEIDVDASHIFIIGENGQGKSNFIESIYYLAYAASFRTRHDARICRHDRSEFALRGIIRSTADNRSEVECYWRAGKKDIRLNGKAIGDRKELVNVVPCIVLDHQDFRYISGSPAFQRFFFDQTSSLCSPLYIETLRCYRHLLRLRNAALRDRTLRLLDVYDEQLAHAGVAIIDERRRLIKHFNLLFSDLYREISQSSQRLQVVYRQSWDRVEAAVELLAKHRSRDIMAATTTSGPHRDRFVFLLGDREFDQVASTGSIRIASIAMRIVQAQLFHAAVGARPTLLVDDVLLEVDSRGRQRLLANLPECEQIYFTFLPGEQHGGYNDAIVYTMTHGALIR